MSKIRNLNAVSLGEKLTIAIDIDGTVADCSKVDFGKVNRSKNEFLKAVPINGALAAVKSLHKQGHIIVFHSSRNHAKQKNNASMAYKARISVSSYCDGQICCACIHR